MDSTEEGGWRDLPDESGPRTEAYCTLGISTLLHPNILLQREVTLDLRMYLTHAHMQTQLAPAPNGLTTQVLELIF